MSFSFVWIETLDFGTSENQIRIYRMCLLLTTIYIQILQRRRENIHTLF